MALYFLVLVVLVTAVWLFAYGPLRPDVTARREAAEPTKPAKPAEPARPAGPPAASTGPPAIDVAYGRACLAEVALVARLLDGTLDPPEYRRAMAELAAADAVRMPVEVPPERLG